MGGVCCLGRVLPGQVDDMSVGLRDSFRKAMYRKIIVSGRRLRER